MNYWIRFGLTVCAIAGIAGPLAAQDQKVTTRFTSFFMGGATADFHPAYARLLGDGLLEQEITQWTEQALAEIPHFNFQPLERRNLGLQRPETRVGPQVLFLRGLVTRADVKRVERWKTDVQVFITTVTLECFDLASGEVFYTRTLSGQAASETARNTALPADKSRQFFRECLRGTVTELVRRIGADYQPGILEGTILEVLDSSRVVMDLGRQQGVYQGMTLYTYDAPGGEAVGLIKAETPQAHLSPAKIIISQGRPLQRGTVVRSFGINRRLKQTEQVRYMVSGFPVSRELLAPEFQVDPQSLGQWLHDGLSENSSLFLLAPLLTRVDDAGNVQVQEALYQAQEAYSIFGSLARSAALGNRAYPDVLIKGSVNYADVQRFKTPGAEKLLLRVGISVAFYDRKTREFLYAWQHAGSRVESEVIENGKVLRKPDLEAGFRSLCETVVSEAAAEIARHYEPVTARGEIDAVPEPQIATVTLAQSGSSPGDLYQLQRVEKQIKGMDGRVLGALYRTYGIVKLAAPVGENRFSAKLLVSDGQTEMQPRDLLIAEGRQARGLSGPLCQVSDWQVMGKVIAEAYRPAPAPLMMGALHDALLSTGKYRLLPPVFREHEVEADQAGLAGGYFEPQARGELILPEKRVPEVRILGRLGYLELKEASGAFKDELKFTAGVELTFTGAGGDTLYQKQLALASKAERVKDSAGRVVKGPIDLAPEFDALIRQVINTLAGRVAGEYAPSW